MARKQETQGNLNFQNWPQFGRDFRSLLTLGMTDDVLFFVRYAPRSQLFFCVVFRTRLGGKCLAKRWQILSHQTWQNPNLASYRFKPRKSEPILREIYVKLTTLELKLIETNMKYSSYYSFFLDKCLIQIKFIDLFGSFLR